ncbi:MAG: zinc finger Ran-binding domain-containing protein [Acidobacteria bacterium]|nr:zinc finger Ran-binding domain-containing protein [Acidobacteriota bacterium]
MQQPAQPRGAFLGAGESAGMSSIWFWAGVYVVAGLVFGALAAHRALQTGNRALAWFGVGFVFTLPGYLYLLTRPKKEMAAPAGVPHGLQKIAATSAPAPCSACGAMNHPSATQCIGCGAKLDPQFVSEAQRAGVTR